MRNFMIWLLVGTLVVVLLAAGLVLAGFGIRMAFSPQIPEEFAATTTASIESFESSYQSKVGGRSIRIRYEANEDRFSVSMPVLSDEWKVGDSLEIRYDMRNPRSVEWVDASPMRRVVGGGVIGGLGLALLAFVGWMLRQIRRAP